MPAGLGFSVSGWSAFLGDVVLQVCWLGCPAGRRLVLAKVEEREQQATDSMTAPARAAAVPAGRSLVLMPMSVTATMIGRPVAANSTIARLSAPRFPGGAVSRPDVPRTRRSRIRNAGNNTKAVGLDSKASRSKVTPVLMKKMGTQEPEPGGFEFRFDDLGVGGGGVDEEQFGQDAER